MFAMNTLKFLVNALANDYYFDKNNYFLKKELFSERILSTQFVIFLQAFYSICSR